MSNNKKDSFNSEEIEQDAAVINDEQFYISDSTGFDTIYACAKKKGIKKLNIRIMELNNNILFNCTESDFQDLCKLGINGAMNANNKVTSFLTGNFVLNNVGRLDFDTITEINNDIKDYLKNSEINNKNDYYNKLIWKNIYRTMRQEEKYTDKLNRNHQKNIVKYYKQKIKEIKHSKGE